MAKTEMMEKRKAKKRKPSTPTEAPHEEKVYLEQPRKASKRKSQSTQISPKRSKSVQRTAADDNPSSDEEIREPTARELQESEKPENQLSIETIRQKKQKSHKKNLQIKQDHTTLKDSERNEEYLTRWKHNRDEWKFIKLRQVSIQNSLLDMTKISDEVFPIALEYFEGAKGAARSALEKTAQEEIKRMDAEFEKNPSLKNDEVKMSRYKRARELLQALL